MYDIQSRDTPRNSFAMASREISEQRDRSRSPAKRQSEAPRPAVDYARVPFPEMNGEERRGSAPGGGLHKRLGGGEGFGRGPSRF